MNKHDVVTIGDCSEDIFITPHKSLIQNSRDFASGKSVSFELGEKINLDDVEFQTGGSAGNSAVALARMGFNVGIITPLGFDTVADKIINKLNEENIDLTHISQMDSIKSNFSIIMNFHSERTIFVYHGLNDYGKLKIPKKISTEWIYLAPVGHGEEELFAKIIPLASQKNIKIAWNPGARQIEKGASHYKSLLGVTEILSLNKEEAIKFTDYPVRPDVKTICKRLYSLGPKIILVTAGKEGAYCFNGEDLWYIGVLPADRVDATGAGDSFTSAFVSRFIHNLKGTDELIEQSLKYAIVESTSVVTKVGAQTGLLSEAQIEEQLEKIKKLRPKQLS